jgi:hypothetical protein
MEKGLLSRGKSARALILATVAVIALSVIGCSVQQREVDPTPERLDGTSSLEFEADDIQRAESASPAVEEYCDGAVSEAQYVGCLSHVTDEDLP